MSPITCVLKKMPVSILKRLSKRTWATGRLIRAALGDIARGRNMSELAREIGMTREGLSEALSEDGELSFGIVLKIIRVLGMRLRGRQLGRCSRQESEKYSDLQAALLKGPSTELPSPGEYLSWNCVMRPVLVR